MLRQLLALIAILCLTCARAPATENASQSFIDPLQLKHFLFLPIVAQETTYSCGAAAMKSLLQYFGLDYTEGELRKILKTTPEGTMIEPIQELAKSLNFEVETREQMSIADLKTAIDEHKPVLILLQAWPETKQSNWEQMWDAGHFVIVVGYDEDKLFIMDPVNSGKYHYVPQDEFLRRWHDIDGQTKVFHFGMTFIPGTKTSTYFPIDRTN